MLPIDVHYDEITQRLTHEDICFIHASTGSGKSSRVPQIILDSNRLARILVTQPRRLACTELASWVAKSASAETGDVGYRIGGECQDMDCKIVYATTAYVAEWISGSLEECLRGITHIVLDEVHESSPEMDFLAVVLKSIAPRRNIKLVVMSATLQTDKWLHYFRPRAQPLVIDCQRFQVRELFIDSDEVASWCGWEDKDYGASVRRFQGSNSSLSGVQKGAKTQLTPAMYRVASTIIRRLVSTMVTPGCILVFLPGLGEISQMSDALRGQHGLQVVWLYSHCDPTERRDAMNSTFRGPRVVLATNIAESSVTVPMVKGVVDFGLRRSAVYDQDRGVTTLEDFWCSKASAKQRAGRTGRMCDGVVVRLFPENWLRLEYDISEVDGGRLARLLLKAHVFVQRNSVDSGLDEFPELKSASMIVRSLVTPPSDADLELAALDLFESGCMAKPDVNSSLTMFGFFASSLPVDIHIARLIWVSFLMGQLGDGILMASPMVLSWDVFPGPGAGGGPGKTACDKGEVNKLWKSCTVRRAFDAGVLSEPIMGRNMLLAALHCAAGAEHQRQRRAVGVDVADQVKLAFKLQSDPHPMFDRSSVVQVVDNANSLLRKARMALLGRNAQTDAAPESDPVPHLTNAFLGTAKPAEMEDNFIAEADELRLILCVAFGRHILQSQRLPQFGGSVTTVSFSGCDGCTADAMKQTVRALAWYKEDSPEIRRGKDHNVFEFRQPDLAPDRTLFSMTPIVTEMEEEGRLPNIHTASRGALQLMTACRNRRKAKVAVDGASDAAVEVAEPPYGPQWRAVRLRRLNRKPAPGVAPPLCKLSWKNPPGWIVGGEAGHRLLAVPASLRNQEGRLHAEWSTILPTTEGGRRAVLMALAGMDLNSHNAENPAAGSFTVHFEAWSRGPYADSLAIFGVSLGAHRTERGCFTLPRDFPISFAKLSCISKLRDLVGQAFVVPGISAEGAFCRSDDLAILCLGIQECVTCLLDHEDLCDCCCGGWRAREDLASPFSSDDVLGGLYHGQLVVHPQSTQSSLISAFDMDRFKQDLWTWWNDDRARRPGPSKSSTMDHNVGLACFECRSCGAELSEATPRGVAICEICMQHRSQLSARPDGGVATFRCKDCGQGLQKHMFSKSQFAGPASQRRCLQCVENSMAELQQRSPVPAPVTAKPSDALFRCQECCLDKPSSLFSKSQRSNPANSRRCQLCVSACRGGFSADWRAVDVEPRHPPAFATSASAVGGGSTDSEAGDDTRRLRFVATKCSCRTERQKIQLHPWTILRVVSSEGELCWVDVDSVHDCLHSSNVRSVRNAVMMNEYDPPTDVDDCSAELPCRAGDSVHFLKDHDGWAEVIKENQHGFVPFSFLEFQ